MGLFFPDIATFFLDTRHRSKGTSSLYEDIWWIHHDQTGIYGLYLRDKLDWELWHIFQA